LSYKVSGEKELISGGGLTIFWNFLALREKNYGNFLPSLEV